MNAQISLVVNTLIDYNSEPSLPSIQHFGEIEVHSSCVRTSSKIHSEPLMGSATSLGMSERKSILTEGMSNQLTARLRRASVQAQDCMCSAGSKKHYPALVLPVSCPVDHPLHNEDKSLPALAGYLWDLKLCLHAIQTIHSANRPPKYGFHLGTELCALGIQITLNIFSFVLETRLSKMLRVKTSLGHKTAVKWKGWFHSFIQCSSDYFSV